MGRIRVYIFDTNQLNKDTAMKQEAMLKGIAPLYVKKYQKLKAAGNIQGSCQELAAGILLSRCLGVCEDSKLCFGEHGKPALTSGDAFFNLSHSGNFVVLAVADKDVGQVGIDIESTSRMSLSVARKVFREDVYEELLLENERDSKRAQALFARHWTTCEARLKLSGAGLCGYDRIKPYYSAGDKDVVHLELMDGQYVIAVAIGGDISTCEVCEKIVKCY